MSALTDAHISRRAFYERAGIKRREKWREPRKRTTNSAPGSRKNATSHRITRTKNTRGYIRGLSRGVVVEPLLVRQEIKGGNTRTYLAGHEESDGERHGRGIVRQTFAVDAGHFLSVSKFFVPVIGVPFDWRVLLSRRKVRRGRPSEVLSPGFQGLQ